MKLVLVKEVNNKTRKIFYVSCGGVVIGEFETLNQLIHSSYNVPSVSIEDIVKLLVVRFWHFST